MATKKTGKARTPKTTAVVSVDTAPVANAEPTAVTPAATTAPTVPDRLTLTDLIPDAGAAPVWLDPMVDAFRAVASMPCTTRDERVAVRDAWVASMAAAMPNTPPPVGRHTGRFTTMHVFEAQNAMYLAIALANVRVGEGAVMAAWRGELPNAACDYLGKNYAYHGTLSDFVNGGHGDALFAGHRDAVRAWVARGKSTLVKG